MDAHHGAAAPRTRPDSRPWVGAFGALVALALVAGALPAGPAETPAHAEPASLTNTSVTVEGEELVAPAGQTTPLRATGAATPATATDAEVAPLATPVERIAGGNRTETAIELSRSFYASTEWVVLARSDDYADALAGAPLAVALEAPILLTPPDRLDTRVRAEIERLGATHVILLGGETALSSAVEDELVAMGMEGGRYAGTDRYGTAALIAEDLPNPEGVAFVVEGANPDPSRGWPDAVSVSGAAAYLGAPILLTTTDRLPDATASILPELDLRQEIMIVGGTAAVSPSVEQEVDALNAAPVHREAGANRYETSELMAEFMMGLALEFQDAMQVDLWVATGRDFPDALAAAPILAALQADAAALLLIDGQGLDGSPASRDLIWLDAPEFRRVVAVGGPAVITEATLDEIRELLDSDAPPPGG